MIPIVGAKPEYERFVRRTLAGFPPAIVTAARVSSIVVSGSREEVRVTPACYRHVFRDIILRPGVGDGLRYVLLHEIIHGVDDGAPEFSEHRFSLSREWVALHRSVVGFRQSSYQSSPEEYFADAVSRHLITGLDTARLVHPYEVNYITRVLFPALGIK